MRDSVLFYRSFYDALKNISPDDRDVYKRQVQQPDQLL